VRNGEVVFQNVAYTVRLSVALSDLPLIVPRKSPEHFYGQDFYLG
jgi:hypothetical protein